MKNITRTITVSTVEILAKKDFSVIEKTVVFTDDDTEGEEEAIKAYLNKAYPGDENKAKRKAIKQTIFGRIISSDTYRGTQTLEDYVQGCIEHGIFEKIEK